MYNLQAIVHKLSHQHLHVKFWIIETLKINTNTIRFGDLEKYAVPVLISRFTEDFKKSNLISVIFLVFFRCNMC